MFDVPSERDPVDLLAEEFLDRRRRNETPTPEDYARQYPALAERIRSVFPALLMLDELAPEVAPTRVAAPPRQLGEFRIIRQIGRGGMGVVYEAVQQSLDRRVALKVLPADTARDPVYLERFKAEARTAARLHHTNIVAVYGAGAADGTHFLVMELIDGVGLDEVLAELRERGTALPSSETREVAAAATPPAAPVRGTPSPTDLPQLYADSRSSYYRSVARLIADAADALAHAHQQGVVHRDVKPSNLLLARNGVVYVSDFGLAKAEGAADLTKTGWVVGTPRYLAPERFEGKEGPSGDVFALGATLYELLTLKPAFEAPSREQLIAQVKHAEPARPRALAPSIARDLETIALTALAKEPGRRPSAAALADDLRRWLDGRPIKARRVGPVERLAIWAKRNPAVATLAASLFLALAAGLAVAIGLWRTSEGHRELAVAKADEADKSRLDALANAALADKRREEADTALNKALDAMDEYFNKVSENKLLEAPGMLSLRNELLGSAMPYYEGFLARHADNPRLKLETLRARVNLARIKLCIDTRPNASAALEEVVLACRELVAELPDNPRARRELGAALESLGKAKGSQNQIAQSIDLYREASAEHGRAPDPASQLNSIRALLWAAEAAFKIGRQSEAVADLKQVRERLDALAPTVKHVAAFGMVDAQAYIAQSFTMRRTDVDAAHAAAVKACEVLTEWLAKQPANLTMRLDKARAFGERAQCELQMQRTDDARASLAAGRELLEKLVAENPHARGYGIQLVVNQRLASNLERDAGRLDEAITLMSQARRLIDRLVAADPSDSNLLRMKAETTGLTGTLLNRRKREEEALEAHGAAGDAFLILYERQPEQAMLLTNAGMCRLNQAACHGNLNRFDEGARLAREGIGHYRTALEQHPKSTMAKTAEEKLLVGYAILVECERSAGRWDAVAAALAELSDFRPTNVAHRVTLARLYASSAGDAIPTTGPPTPEQAKQFDRFAALAVETLQTAAKTNAAGTRKAFKPGDFKAIRHVEAFRRLAAEFQLSE